MLWYSDTRVTSYKLRVESLNFKSASSNPRVTSSSLQVTSSNPRVPESLNQWKLK